MGIELRCHFSGHVQGVGFRWRTARALQDLPLAGYVRNLADGRVELRVQGERDIVQEAVERVRTAMASNIDAVDIEEHPIEESLGRFTIR